MGWNNSMSWYDHLCWKAHRWWLYHREGFFSRLYGYLLGVVYWGVSVWVLFLFFGGKL